MAARLPTYYIPHGGGPWPYVDLGVPPDELEGLTRFLWSLPGGAQAAPEPRPRAVLVISAHWEAARPTVATAARPGMLYDYYGFPEAAYRFVWPAPGAPELAKRVKSLLDAAGHPVEEDPERGFDHGSFVPLSVAYPDPRIPVGVLSLVASLDPATHLSIGAALEPLRDEGVLIVGSGMSFHNMRAFLRGGDPRPGERFDAWLADAVKRPETRDARLRQWSEAPGAREAHPREEHLLPLMVAAGAAGQDEGRVVYAGRYMGQAISAVRFGTVNPASGASTP